MHGCSWKAGRPCSTLDTMSFILRSAAIFALTTLSFSQTSAMPKDFSITLERIGCLGSCPDYKVTIRADGSVVYEGRYYVKVEGIRKAVISLSDVQKLVEKLRTRDFFNWEEKKEVCVDYPEVDITVNPNRRRKRVIEGCNKPGQVLTLAEEIDRISGSKRWVGNVH
jgi:hypothetical protein